MPWRGGGRVSGPVNTGTTVCDYLCLVSSSAQNLKTEMQDHRLAVVRDVPLRRGISYANPGRGRGGGGRDRDHGKSVMTAGALTVALT